MVFGAPGIQVYPRPSANEPHPWASFENGHATPPPRSKPWGCPTSWSGCWRSSSPTARSKTLRSRPPTSLTGTGNRIISWPRSSPGPQARLRSLRPHLPHRIRPRRQVGRFQSAVGPLLPYPLLERGWRNRSAGSGGGGTSTWKVGAALVSVPSGPDGPIREAWWEPSAPRCSVTTLKPSGWFWRSPS